MRPPQYLDQVEGYIGLPFFSDPALADQVRTDPGLIDSALLGPRSVVYFAALRLLHSEQVEPAPLFTAAEATSREIIRRRTVGVLRGELMTIDPGLETPPVRELRQALEALPPPDILAPWELPIRSVSQLVVIRPGDVLTVAERQPDHILMRQLPGDDSPERCCDWNFVRLLARAYGLRHRFEGLALDMLPHSDTETDPDRIAYARKLQIRIVPINKLRNVPDLAAALPKASQRRMPPYYISRALLARVLGGDLAFVDDSCEAQRLDEAPQSLRGKYLLLEEAARIRGAYFATPLATPDYVSVDGAAWGTEISPGLFRSNLLPSETRAIIMMRARGPEGHVLPHLPAIAARQAMNRLRPQPLPPHLIATQMLTKYFAAGPEELTAACNSLGAATLPRHLSGVDTMLDCCNWTLVYRLQHDQQMPVRRGLQIDFDRLPLNEYDLDPNRVAYARDIQSLLVDHPQQVDTTPVVSWIGQRLEAISSEYAGRFGLPPLHNPNHMSGAQPNIQMPQHDYQAPGSWQPVVEPLAGALLDPLDELTARQIADRLDISVGEVRDAARRIDPGDLQPEYAQVAGQREAIYTGSLLVSLREQLAGVPVGVIGILHNLNPGQLEHARQYLIKQGYPIFAGDRCSPWAFELLCQHIEHLKDDAG
jgi:hypothetical protein